MTAARQTASDARVELLDRLWSEGLVEHTVSEQDRPLYTIVALVADPLPEPAPDRRAGPFVLSRFAIIRREADEFIIESPLARCALRVHDPAVLAVVGSLTEAGTLPVAGALRRATVAGLLDVLRRSGLTVPLGAEGTEEDTDPRLSEWDAHELWFRWRSRPGSHTAFSGRPGRHEAPGRGR